ncbi:hypothetical protein BGZ83_007523 [Gryganskiella cystojenkinii]|nr:hypothetical protein BGZ83_007523 [Gryganskiella cystojenkinii]
MSTIVQKADTAQQPAALAVNLGTNIALSLITLGAFCWLRPRNGVIYAPKFHHASDEKRPPKLEGGYFSWMKPVWSCPDTDLVDKIGLDAVVFIRFTRMTRRMFQAMTVIGCGVLIPINVIATIRAQQQQQIPADKIDKIAMLTMSGITNLNWLWAHVGATWLFSLILYMAMYHGYVTFLKYRIQYFESEGYQENMASRTLMLAGLPNSLQDDEKLSAFMSNLGVKDKPVQALVGRKVDKLPDLMKKHKEMVTKLEKVMAKYFKDPLNPPKKRPTVREGSIFGPKVDAIDYYSHEIEVLSDQIEQTRSELNKTQPTNYAFVSYATIHAAHRTAKELSNTLTYRQRAKLIDPPDLFLSPVPKDIIWFNVSNPKAFRKSRKILVNALFILGSLLFFIPMGILSAFANLNSIIGLFPQTKDYFTNPKNAFVAGMVQSLLPVLIMDILMLLVRKLIVYLAWLQGNITKSATDRSTLAKFYLFFTMNNLIFFALSNIILAFFAQLKLILASLHFNLATWRLIKNFLEGQHNIIEIVSQNVIDSSLFWVNYVSLRNFSALLDLSQVVTLVLYWAKSTVTPREKKGMEKPPVFDFPLFISAQLFLLTVALLYSVIAPLVLLFAAIYFSLASLVYKYQLMYVFRTKVETGGRLFRVIYNRLFVALILFQIVMIGILNLKLAHKHSLALIPLPILSLVFKFFLSKRYDPKIDFYDYGSARNEMHLFKTNRHGDVKSKSNSLSMNFENPALHARKIVALVPDGARKMLSSKVLGGDENREKHHKSHKRSRSKSRHGRSASVSSKGRKSNEIMIEMRSVSRASSRSRGGYESEGYRADDQKQSLTQAAARRYGDSYSKNSSSHDISSFVASRYSGDEYRAGRNDSFSGSINRNENSVPVGTVSVLELARLHETGSYTGKAKKQQAAESTRAPGSARRRDQQQQQQLYSSKSEISDATKYSYDIKAEFEETYVGHEETYVTPASAPLPMTSSKSTRSNASTTKPAMAHTKSTASSIPGSRHPLNRSTTNDTAYTSSSSGNNSRQQKKSGNGGNYF